MKKAYKTILLIFVVVLLIITYFSYPIFYVADRDTYTQLCQNVSDSPDDNMWIKLKYTVSTGVSWYIEECSDKAFGGYAVLENLADLRYLKINDDFFVDTRGHIIVSAKGVEHINYKGEKVVKINPDRIYIYIDGYTGIDDNYTLSDMSFVGIVKALFGIFIPAYRYSI